jgi:hypothetical protein
VRDLQAIADRVEIEALCGEFTDAVMMRDYGRGASLFTHDSALRMPNIPAKLVGRAEIRAWGERMPALVDQVVAWSPRSRRIPSRCRRQRSRADDDVHDKVSDAAGVAVRRQRVTGAAGDPGCAGLPARACPAGFAWPGVTAGASRLLRREGHRGRAR